MQSLMPDFHLLSGGKVSVAGESPREVWTRRRARVRARDIHIERERARERERERKRERGGERERFRVPGFGFRVSGFMFRISGFGFHVSGFRSRSGVVPLMVVRAEPPCEELPERRDWILPRRCTGNPCVSTGLPRS